MTLGGGQGFYGDGRAPLGDLLEAGIDYLVCESLAELTMAILQKDRQRDERLGYTRDLPAYFESALPYLLDGRTKLVTNAGGLNPLGAARALIAVARRLGPDSTGLRIGIVLGDDLQPLAPDLGLPCASSALFANVYLGGAGIARALDLGAHVVITGRVADASLFVAPLVHEFGWSMDDWDRLAAGVAVGHLLECSGQVTGGNYSGPWWRNPNPSRIGFPIAEVAANGSAVITKPPGTGGQVTFDTVREQLLYEVHDPSRYLNPDVCADFASLVVTDLGDDRVQLHGARGAPAPATYKGLVGSPFGWAGECNVTFTWPDAPAKARAALAYVRARAETLGTPVEEWCEEYFGLDPDRPGGGDPPEVTGRLAWRTAREADAARVAAEVPVLGLSGPPGMRALSWGGRRGPKPSQLLAVEPFFIDRDVVDPQVRVEILEV